MHASTPTTRNTGKYDIKHTITPTQHGSADPILTQSDIIQVHQQKVKTLAETEQEIYQKQKTVTNIYDICNSNKSSMEGNEVSNDK